MASRLELHEKLCELLGSRNVYFQPPESVKMRYPAIVYDRSDIQPHFANNVVYRSLIQYDLTIITDDPDSVLIEEVSALPLCRYDRHYTSDNLHHDVFKLYY